MRRTRRLPSLRQLLILVMPGLFGVLGRVRGPSRSAPPAVSVARRGELTRAPPADPLTRLGVLRT